ncbi:hypothetical protein F0562_030814 [Nyssa sinensis]|uniref:Leucine-rich repeat-containing N-terminal plant-type domain-containing protein n=1 Tax=Nyssa sinensis TaxID=561372 RepID=A0A5J5B101_9ASTE|nr:hypothetical protein F0562_030814 [Nyssa sinensis]
MASSHQLMCSLFLAVILQQIVTSSSLSDSEILLNFTMSLSNNAALSTWNASTPPCSSGGAANWAGVLCEKGIVWGLQLENMGLKGAIDIHSLKKLHSLRTLSLMNNSFDGPLPNIKELGKLKSVYFSNNKFSGDIQANAFDGMLSLKKVHLAQNQFTGPIPLSLTILPRLLELRLEGNQFEGEIPDFQQDRLKLVDVSNNELEGQIPHLLTKMGASSFSGNKDLCGPPLGLCPSSKNLSVGMIVVVVIVVAAALAAIAAVFIILRQRCPTSQWEEASTTSSHIHKKMASSDLDKMERGSPEHSSNGSKNADNEKLTFLREDRVKFDLPDLLKASAEILGQWMLWFFIQSCHYDWASDGGEEV